MSTTIDERVVEMRFDNKQFESNVQTSLSTIDKLKQSLNLTGASKGLENVGAAAKSVNMSGLSGAVETVHAKFSAFEVMAVTALANITNSAVNAGKRMVAALTIDPVKSGFQEYETQINAIQTILANTESKGSTLKDVNKALGELNTYADKTIYNFTEMTRNIGTFTAAGVDLDTSVSAIKGIANLAAVSGSTSQQASTAMYQLSQALASGTVKLQDWNSVVNAGMGGQVFQDALKETARVHGIAIDDMIASEGSFRETLSKGWLSSEILTETLSKFTGDLTEAQLQSMGYSEEQIASIIKMGNTANDAATKVKTATQLFDTLKEAAQSGWTKTWELVIGDFEEAKELYTGISDTVGEFINNMSDSRNNLLEGALTNNWDKLVGKINEAGVETTAFEEKLRGVMEGHGLDVDKLLEQYGSFEKIFKSGTVSSKYLKEAVHNLNTEMVDLSSITKELKKGDTGEDVKKIQEALIGQGLDVGSTGADGIFGSATEEAIKKFQELHGLKVTGILDESTITALKEASGATNTLIEDVDGLIDKITELGGREKLIESFKNIFKALGDVVKPIKEAFSEVFPPITVERLVGLIDKFKSFTEGLRLSDSTMDKLKRTSKGFFSAIDLIGKGFKALLSPLGTFFDSGIVSGIGDALLTITAKIGDFFTSLNESTNVAEFMTKVSDGIKGVINDIAGVLVPGLDKVESFGDVFSKVGEIVKNVAGKIGDGIKTAFGFASDNFSAGDVFAGLAGGGIFVAAKKFSGLLNTIKEGIENFFDKGKGGELKEQISDILGSVKDSLTAFTSGIKVASLLGIAIAIAVLSASLNSLSKIDPDKLGTALLGMAAMFAMLTISFKAITKTLDSFDSKGLIKAGVAMVLMAAALKILSGALIAISGLSIEELGKGLVALGLGLAELVAALKFLDGVKVSLTTSVAMLALAQACKMLSTALAGFAKLSWGEIARGLTAMGGALAELTASLSVLSKAGGFGALLGAGGMLVAVQSLDEIADALERLGQLSWSEIGRGLAAMGGALAEFTAALSVMSAVGGFGALLSGGGLLIAVQSLKPIGDALTQIGGLSWDTIARGLVGMGGALTELGVVLGVLGTLGGFSSVLASAAILIAAQALKPIGDALASIGDLSWDTIARGLVGMGGALTELGVVTGLLGSLSGLSGVLGAGAILLGVQGLGDLADALKKFGEMTFDEIGRGLVGMGGALTEVAVITGTLGSLTGLAGLVGSGSLLLGIQGLGDLADALKKFGEMSWDEIGAGLTAMGAAMGETALGGLLNTFSGFGAAAISEMAAPLGDLATSVQKWSGVTVPDGLADQLGSLADGVSAFTFGGFGASALSEAATPLGDLAASVQKWSGVTVPDDIGTGLSNLASGVKEFTFGGWGADTVAEVATPLGTLATSVGKWSSITVPSDIETTLTGLANGVSAWSYVDTWNLSNVTEPVGTFADSVSKWSGISISDSIGTSLSGLADGVGAFDGISTSNISSVCDGLTEIGDSVTSVSSIDFSGLTSKLTNFASSIQNIQVSADSFKNLGTSIVNNFASSISSGASTVSNAGKTLTTSVANGMKAAASNITSAITSLMTSANTSIIGKKETFQSAGTSLMSSLASGIRACAGSVSSAASSTASSGASGARGAYGSFYSAGSYIGSGLASGLNSQYSNVAAAAARLANAAAAAARAAAKIHSPSRVFMEIGSYIGEGFVIGMNDYNSGAYDAGSQMGLFAKDGITKTISGVSDILNNASGDALTLRPVLDLSSVEKDAGRLNGILGLGKSIGITSNIGAIASSMNDRQRQANGNDIVSAINKLQKVLGNNRGDSYTINGITYDDGSNVSSAIKTLVRATKMERRV